MTKDQFLNELYRSIQNIPEIEKRDIIQDYEEHFQMGQQEGKSEEEIAKALGAPSQIAKELLATYHIEKVESNVSTGNIFRAMWAVIGLGFFNLVIVFAPFLALTLIILSGWLLGVSFLASPIFLLIDIFVLFNPFEAFYLFIALFLVGLGILICIGMFYITKAVTKGFVRYLKYNVSLVKGGLKDE